jgi:hypothetical protein
MTTTRVSRRAALTASFFTALGLVACAEDTVPPSFAPLGWDYLPKLKLNVATIDIDDSWRPRAGTRERGFLAPTSPVEALRKMADDRLIPGGSSGRALFVIDDASIQQSRDFYEATFAVHLDISTSDGVRSGYAEARVSRRRAINDDSPNGVRAELYELVKQMMADMNVEFEFRVNRALHDYLQTTAPAVPDAGPVERQELAPPPPDETSPPAPADAFAAPPRPSAVPFSSPGPIPLTR